MATDGKNKAREEVKRMRTGNENKKGKSRREEFEGRKGYHVCEREEEYEGGEEEMRQTGREGGGISVLEDRDWGLRFRRNTKEGRDRLVKEEMREVKR